MKHLTNDFFKNRQSRAIGSAFFSLGILFGTWATAIPFVKAKFDLNDADLGLILLSMPAGSVLMNVVGAWLIQKVGMRSTTIYGMIFMALAFLLPLNVPKLWLVPVGLFLAGSAISITNIAMNMGATCIEHDQKVNILSTCHGMFSVGLMMGSLLASLARGLQILPGHFMLLVSVSMVILALSVKRTVYKIKDDKESHDQEGARFFFPKGVFLIIVIIGICGNITEGTMADWTSVWMKEIAKADLYMIGWGLSGYSFFMALGRFFGDKIIPVLGAQKILIYGGLLVALGLAIVIAFPNPWSSILGFSLVGAGVSCEAPILYGLAARMPGMAKGSGLAVLNTFTMFGFMSGPVLIGFISAAMGLKVAMALILCLALVWSALSPKVKNF